MSAHCIKTAEQKCRELQGHDGIRFAGVISRLGSLVAGGFGPGIVPLETEEKNRMMYMQMALDLTMRRDFDSSLGEIEYVASRRRNVLMISVPLNGDLLLISAEPSASAEGIVAHASAIFSDYIGGETLV